MQLRVLSHRRARSLHGLGLTLRPARIRHARQGDGRRGRPEGGFQAGRVICCATGIRWCRAC
eukprot:15463732-Alexandrium_andersonii.AAC.1